MITILTPTYNRDHTLPNLYNSLVYQTHHSFEWLIIDDGSNDSTEELVSKLIDAAPFTIRYIKKENGGKHSALNIGFKESKYDWIFIVDSDDTLKEETVEVITKETSQLPNEFNSVSILRIYPNGDVIGEKFPSHLESYVDKIYYGVEGDKADIIRKSALKGFSFPEFNNENFMAESPLFLWLGQKGKTKFLNFKGYICDYLPQGLTDKSIENRHKCVNSTLYVYYNQYNTYESKKLRAKAAINWWRFRLFKTTSSQILHNNIPVIYLPFGLLLFAYDFSKNKTN